MRLLYPAAALFIAIVCAEPWRADAAAADIRTPGAQSPTRDLPGADSNNRGKTNLAPALPGTKTAADTFRELLAMSSAERERALADRTEHQRKYLEDSLREYDGLTPEQREARLKELELKCHLTILTKLAPDKRTDRLNAVPPDLRSIVEERLKQWDRLPGNVRQEVLEYDTTANYFLRVRPVQSSPPPGRDFFPAPAAAAEERRSPGHISQFFSLPPKEQQKTIDALPPGEREEIEKTLKKFAALPEPQRTICVQSFEKFSHMSPEERDQFLKNAARWKAMSRGERDTWRALLEILPPSSNATELPPMPPGASGPVTASNAPVIR